MGAFRRLWRLLGHPVVERVRAVVELVRAWVRALDERLDAFVLYRAIWAIVRVFRESACFARTGEVSFYAILSVVPFGALLVWAAGLALPLVFGPQWSMDDVLEAVRNVMPELVPGAHATAENIYQALTTERGAFGVFGFLSLLISSSLAFGAVDRSMAAVFKVRKRSRVTLLFFFSILLAGLGMILLMSLAVLGGLRQGPMSAAGLSDLAGDTLLVDRLADVVLAVGFVLLIEVVLKRRVRLLHALAGAGVFVGSFELARYLYALYLATASRFNVVYGSLAGTMATVVWIYYVVLTFMVSLCLVRVLTDRLYVRNMQAEGPATPP